MKEIIFNIISCILMVILASGFLVCIWGEFILGVKVILTSVVLGCLLSFLETEI